MKSKPKIVFFALYRHHRRYFNKLKEGLADEYNTSVLMIHRFFFPPRIAAGMSSKEKERIIKYQFLRGELRYRHLFRFRVFMRFYKAVLGWAAGVFFANYRYYLEKENIAAIAVWNGCNLPLAAAVAAARRCGVKTLFFENGPFPNTTALDEQGINFGNSFPRTPEFFWTYAFDQKDLDGENPCLVPRTPRKGKPVYPRVELPDNYIFVPFQTYNDTQVLLYSPWIRGMEDLLTSTVKAREKAKKEHLWLVFKEHPSCRIEYSHLRSRFEGKRVLFANGNSTQELIQNSRGVITINSSVGIEALLLKKKVITLGLAFYNIPGLVLTAGNFQELVQCWEELESWRADEELRKRFLYYLKHCYLIEGSWKSAGPVHLQEIKERMQKILF